MNFSLFIDVVGVVATALYIADLIVYLMNDGVGVTRRVVSRRAVVR